MSIEHETITPSLELVGGGLAEWPSGQGPRGETIAAAAFVDATGHAAILELPHHFHQVGMAGWECAGTWSTDPLTLIVTVSAPVHATFTIGLVAGRHGPLIEAILRDGAVYICPTSVSLGINARLARDQSFFCAIDRSFAVQWRTIKAQG